MNQPDLLSWRPPAPQSILGDRGGVTFHRPRDGRRLNKQAQAVWNVMRDGNWYTLRQLSDLTGYPEASVSARYRDFSKPEFQDPKLKWHTEREHVSKGLWRYRLVIEGEA
jgi:hypothetical protein